MKQQEEIESGNLIITKYAHFDTSKVQKYPRLEKYFQKRNIPILNKMLEQQQDWEVEQTIGVKQKIDRQPFLQCMVTNFCHFIDFRYMQGAEINLILPIRFINLKDLTFSVNNYECGHLDSIQFLQNLYAPNLKRLDFSRVQEGGYSLRPLRKCFFPKLKQVEIWGHANIFREYEKLTEGNFPLLRNLILFEEDYKEVEFNYWKAKMESKFIQKEYRNKIGRRAQEDNQISSQSGSIDYSNQ